MKKTIISAYLLLWGISAFAQDGGTAMNFTRIYRDPSVSGMAGAGSALGSAAWATFGNSATLPFSAEKADMAASYQGWAPKGIASGGFQIGSAFRLGDRAGIAAGLVTQKGRPYDIFDDQGNASGTFTPSELILGASASFRLKPAAAAGINLRYSTERLSTANAYGAVACDLYFLFHKECWDITVGVLNAGTSVKSMSGASFSLPASAKAAADYRFPLGEKFALSLAADVDYFFCGGISTAAGADLLMFNMVSLRAGYNLAGGNTPLPSHAAIGADVRFAGVRFDFSFLFASPALAGSMLFGLGYSF